jgi:hypothetical protein
MEWPKFSNPDSSGRSFPINGSGCLVWLLMFLIIGLILWKTNSFGNT